MNVLEEKSLLNEENYDSVFNIIVANDPGSVNVAWSILENVDFNESFFYIMCLLKDLQQEIGNFRTLLKEKAPRLYLSFEKYCQQEGITNLRVSYKTIYDLVKKNNHTADLSFMTKRFAKEISKLLIEYGFDFLEDFEITLKPKN